ncbi:Dehydrogenase [Nesidiocoris tenuis]|uniref:Dehydrogenase n=1 Tax=Nesidiocoris tenuis TaxID=355587 RepID=A0ABN7AXM5_9HEMI|nr:Dehydrogenase [Nesidiocoris tenuis]
MGIVVKAFIVLAQYTILNNWFLALLIPIVIFKMVSDRRRKSLDTNGRLDGKTYIVTGCNKGVGLHTAVELSKRGARVLMACKNLGSAHLVKNAIARYTNNDDIEVYRLDLSSFWSVRQFAKDVIENEGRIDGIIFNAGIGIIKNKLTKDGLPLVWQVNHLSPLMIVQLLGGFLKKAESAQIIFVSSVFHHFDRLDVDNLQAENGRWPSTIFCNTKLANIMTSMYLAKKLKDTGITVNCVNPGLVNTQILRRFKSNIVQSVIEFLLEQFGKPEVDGAATTLTVALNPALKSVTGKYFSNCQESHCLSSKAKDLKLAERLWENSNKLLGLHPDEKMI